MAGRPRITVGLGSALGGLFDVAAFAPLGDACRFTGTAAQIVKFRAADDATAPPVSNGSAVEFLRAAAAERQRVWIGFVDRRGAAGEVVLEPVNVGGGVVEGRDAVDGLALRVPLHLITSIAAVEDESPARRDR